jgi:hypothetical protein
MGTLFNNSITSITVEWLVLVKWVCLVCLVDFVDFVENVEIV